ncbi:MAG TPA: hypothetical protein VFU51_11475, partial [Gaiellaceae bacterium]|nr:hypothetical protein [Gaiellaceae bacterium]
MRCSFSSIRRSLMLGPAAPHRSVLREAGPSNLGVVLQADLRRTLDDVRALADLRPSVWLCKGIYVEPPALAFVDDESVRASYVRCVGA